MSLPFLSQNNTKETSLSTTEVKTNDVRHSKVLGEEIPKISRRCASWLLMIFLIGTKDSLYGVMVVESNGS